MKKINFASGTSIYVISDIHGGLHLLQELLEYVKPGNILIILGDLIEKGEHSLATLEYIIKLSKLDNVYIIKGNNDEALVKVFSPEHLDYFLNRMDKPTSIVYEMIAKHKLNCAPELMHQQLAEIYREELKWLDGLETMIETDDFIFVHAGIDNIVDYWNSSPISLTRLANFYLKGHQANKIVVCGHYPTDNYSKHQFNDNIIIDLPRKMICIDGGYGAKSLGQLNMLEIINDNGIYHYRTYAADGYPEVAIIKAQAPQGNSRGINYPDYEIHILEHGQYFSKVRMVSGEVVYVKNEMIIFKNNQYYAIDDTPSNLLGVEIGDKVKLVNTETKGYALVKKDGISGWVSYDCLPSIDSKGRKT